MPDSVMTRERELPSPAPDAVAAALGAADAGDVEEARRLLSRSGVDGWGPLAGILAARQNGDMNLVAQATRNLLARLDGRHGASAPRAIAWVALGTAQMWGGVFDQAEQWLDRGGRAAHELGLEPVAAEALEHRGLLAAMRGRLGEACERANEALRLAARHGASRSRHTVGAMLAVALVHWHRTSWDDADRYLDLAIAARSTRPAALAASIVKARVAQSRHDATNAGEHLTAAHERARGWDPPPLLRTWLTVAQAEQEILEDRPGAAVAVLHRSGSGNGHLSTWLSVTEARALIGCGAPAKARSVLAPLCAGGRGTSDAIVDAWLLDALAADRLGLGGAVCVALTEALAAAEAENIRRPFVALPGELLERHRDLVRAHTILADVVAVREETQLEPCRPPVEPISEREAVVLRYLPTLLTAREIASELYVSPNTVKSQLKSIYRKLDVGTRRDAVDRARRLGLV